MTSLSFGTDASRIVRTRTGASQGVVFTSAKSDCLSNINKNRTVIVQDVTNLDRKDGKLDRSETVPNQESRI